MKTKPARTSYAWVALAVLALSTIACSLFSIGADQTGSRSRSDQDPDIRGEEGGESGEVVTGYEGLPAGDPQNGEEIFNTMACHTCHSDLPVGPPLPGEEPVATLAANRRPGYTAGQYLYESIVEPDAFLVEGYQRGVMPSNFDNQLSQQEIADLIAYLLSLR